MGCTFGRRRCSNWISPLAAGSCAVNRNRGLEERVSREGSFDSIFTRVTVSALCCVERKKIYIYICINNIPTKLTINVGA